jgi:hypothetical protein
MSNFQEIMDRQLAPDKKGESERQAKGDKREGYGHKRSARKRSAKRLAR